MSETINAFQMAQRQFDEVASQFNLDPSEYLKCCAGLRANSSS
jgi:hypothetical protein